MAHDIAWKESGLKLGEHGWNGFLGDNEDELATAAHNIDKLRRKDCHRSAETKFSIEALTGHY